MLRCFVCYRLPLKISLSLPFQVIDDEDNRSIVR